VTLAHTTLGSIECRIAPYFAPSGHGSILQLKHPSSRGVPVHFQRSATHEGTREIETWEIETWEIETWEIETWEIETWEIETWEIETWEIEMWEIEMYETATYPVRPSTHSDASLRHIA
jgi:hypothetical protein